MAFGVVCTGWAIAGVVDVSRGFDGLVSPDLGFQTTEVFQLV